MEEYRAVPKGYMLVGEVARKMNTTVRTLQYYDQKNILTPSSESEGGRRLYTDKDIIKLHQIQSMKYLGFSLDDIKNRLVALETPEQVAAALTEHAAAVQEKLAVLSETLHAIDALKQEVLEMQSVDWRKYAEIVVQLQGKNEMYTMIKYLDENMLDHVHRRFDRDSGEKMSVTINRLFDEAIQLKNSGVSPGSEQGQAFVKAFWEAIVEFTGGDMSLLPSMVKLDKSLKQTEGEWNRRQAQANEFIGPALSVYFETLGCNPFVNNEP